MKKIVKLLTLITLIAGAFGISSCNLFQDRTIAIFYSGNSTDTIEEYDELSFLDDTTFYYDHYHVFSTLGGFITSENSNYYTGTYEGDPTKDGLVTLNITGKKTNINDFFEPCTPYEEEVLILKDVAYFETAEMKRTK